jgi:hypothetical protein
MVLANPIFIPISAFTMYPPLPLLPQAFLLPVYTPIPLLTERPPLPLHPFAAGLFKLPFTSSHYFIH